MTVLLHEARKHKELVVTSYGIPNEFSLSTENVLAKDYAWRLAANEFRAVTELSHPCWQHAHVRG